MDLLSRLFGKQPQASNARHGGSEMASLVVLMSSWEERTAHSIRQELDQLFPGSFLPARDEGNFVLEGPLPNASFLVQCHIPKYAGLFLIHNVPAPYGDGSDWLARTNLKHLAAKQSCWMSVDMIGCHTGEDEAYRFMGAVLASLAPADSALLVQPSRRLARPFTPELRQALASGRLPFGWREDSANDGSAPDGRPAR